MKKKVVKAKSQQLSQDAKIAVFSLIVFFSVVALFLMMHTQVQQQANGMGPGPCKGVCVRSTVCRLNCQSCGPGCRSGYSCCY